MTKQGTVILFHGRDWESALDILNNGLSIEKLKKLQTGRPVQLGMGLYTTDNINVAWYFASISPRSINHPYTMIKVELFQEHLEMLMERGLAIKGQISDTAFEGDQIWFHVDAFEFLN